MFSLSCSPVFSKIAIPPEFLIADIACLIPFLNGISEGDIVRLEPGTFHQLIALEDSSEIFEVSTPDTGELIRIEPGDNQNG